MSSEENKKNGKNKKKNSKGKFLLIIIIVAAIIAGAVYGVFAYQKSQKEKEEKTLAYTKLVTDMQDDKVEKIEMKTKSDTVKIKLKEDDKEYEAIVPENEAFINSIKSKNKLSK